MSLQCTRTAATLITLFGCVTNSVLVIQVAAAWRSFNFKWEQESDWEALGDKLQMNGLKLIWALFFVYFASSAIVCAVGLHGVLKVCIVPIPIPTFSHLSILQGKRSHVRFYRDYSIADFVFCSVSAMTASYAAFLGPARAGVCEELSRHPEIMRDMLELGLNLENCELWLERAVFAIVAIMFVVMIVRVSDNSHRSPPIIQFSQSFWLQLHLLLAVSNYYSQIARNHSCHHYSYSHHYHSHSHSNPLQRIFLVPNSTTTNVVDADPENWNNTMKDQELVYAPVPRGSLPQELQDLATEAWVSTVSSSSQHGQHRRHSRHHHRHRNTSKERTGRIALHVEPGEGLLPPYESSSVDPKA